MNIEKLREVWTGVPVETSRDFSSLEAELQCTLPEEYKQLHETFGIGGFGEACLFHPKRTSTMVKLPDAAIIIREMLLEAGDDTVAATLRTSTIALGMALPRVYFLWHFVEKRWLIWESEYDQQTVLNRLLKKPLISRRMKTFDSFLPLWTCFS